jgi:hypothetical protein
MTVKYLRWRPSHEVVRSRVAAAKNKMVHDRHKVEVFTRVECCAYEYVPVADGTSREHAADISTTLRAANSQTAKWKYFIVDGGWLCERVVQDQGPVMQRFTA